MKTGWMKIIRLSFLFLFVLYLVSCRPRNHCNDYVYNHIIKDTFLRNQYKSIIDTLTKQNYHDLIDSIYNTIDTFDNAYISLLYNLPVQATSIMICYRFDMDTIWYTLPNRENKAKLIKHDCQNLNNIFSYSLTKNYKNICNELATSTDKYSISRFMESPLLASIKWINITMNEDYSYSWEYLPDSLQQVKVRNYVDNALKYETDTNCLAELKVIKEKFLLENDILKIYMNNHFLISSITIDTLKDEVKYEILNKNCYTYIDF